MCDLRHLVQNCTFFVQLSFMGGFQYFFENLFFFGTPMPQKKIREPYFSLKKSLEKQKCVYKLFQSNS